MRTLIFDIRDALRGFRRDRAYAATVVLTLALTIGATTAVFSIVNGVLLQPLSYREPEQLVALREVWRQTADRVSTMEVNERHFEYWRTHAKSFESMAQYRITSANLTGAGEAAQIVLGRSSGSLFEVLGKDAALGRTLSASDDPEGTPDVVAISDALWRQRFAADPTVVGRPMVLDGRTYAIVGVLRPDFHLPDDSQQIDAFIPIRVNVGWVGDHNDQAIGRLARGVTMERARAELDVLQKQVSELASNESHERVNLSSAVSPLVEHVVGSARRGLLLLLGAIAGVLLIACSNLANLALTRTLGQAREAAIRSALGASRRRLLARTLLEQLLLSTLGGALGVWIAWLGLRLFVRTAPIDLPRVKDVALDERVLAFAAVISVLTGLLVALVPAWRAGRRDTQAALRAGALSVTGDRSARRSHSTLLALQVALSVTLLVVTALLATSLLRVLTVDRGFTSAQVLAVDLALPGSRYADEPVRQAAYDRLIAAVRAIPGVQHVTTTSLLPLRWGTTNFIVAEGSSATIFNQPSANFRFVAPEFFQTLGLGILRGRSFTDTERDPRRPAPALISEPVAQRLWPGQDPIGKRFSRGIEREQGFEVVGVVADARLTSLDRTPPYMVYLPYWWRSRPATSLLIKTAVEPSAIVASVRRAVHAIDPEIAVGQSRLLDELVDAAVAGRRYQARLFIAFGLVALFIATVGVYAVTSNTVSRRRREMNIRVALGAPLSQVVGLILRQATRPVLVGLAAGTIGALALGSVVASLLFQVRARDPVIVAGVVMVVGSISVATSLFATRRRLTVDPASALREE
jgi:putative ABC transport system permease protein